MSFANTLDNLLLEKSSLVRGFEQLIAPKSDVDLELMAQTSRALTLQNFGRTMRLFAPLYLSNECINNCRYCGFSRDNPILRVTLGVGEVVAEARHLSQAGFRQILLVSGEHPKFVSRDYLADCVRALKPDFSSIAIEVGPMETKDYFPIVEAGAEGLVVYQETYNRGVYAALHTVPQVGIVLSTREKASLRDALVSLGVTMMSAGSHTEPGGYTRQGGEHLHRTVRGRIVAPEFQDGEDRRATGQFEISDERSPVEIANVLRRRGLEPVWKDWDQALSGV